ncbi:MFS general substrate transporter [Aspergillus sergii]|uniref:MFS general substrate transporter n=1 Tax=Aspergillus sergii TaxID=1034303 RepID=A0A5N6WSG4_9EURO|nr:MFS general substrate transporter [Aspergillus sergii]
MRSRNVLIATFLVATNLVQMIAAMTGIAGGRALSEFMGIHGEGKNWPAASFSLTQGTFVLVTGRLGDVYGHKVLLLIGGFTFTLWTFICCASSNFAVFNIARALAGFGSALIMPNAIGIIGTTYPPGRMRNLVLGSFGATGPLGGYVGGIVGGLIFEHSSWKWLFIFIGIFGTITFLPLYFLLPKNAPADRGGHIDWPGAALVSAGFILFNVVWNQAPEVGWSTTYEIALLVVAMLVLITFGAWEHLFARHPIMPMKIFKAPSFLPLVVVVLLSYMSFGNLQWYMVLWQQDVRGWSVLQFSLGWTPFAIAGTLGAGLAAWLIPRIAAQWIIAIGAVSTLISNVLVVTMPAQQIYWAQIFPATILISFCPDFIYTAAQIVASNSVSHRDQGIAGSLIGALNLYGCSLGIGFGSTVEAYIQGKGGDVLFGYRAALYFGIALAAIAIMLDVFLVRVGKDERQGWDEDVAEETLGRHSHDSCVTNPMV